MEIFSYKEVQLKMFCLPVKTSCLPAVNMNETPANAQTRSGTRSRERKHLTKNTLGSDSGGNACTDAFVLCVFEEDKWSQLYTPIVVLLLERIEINDA